MKMMTKEKSRLMKASIQLSLIDDHRSRDMKQINYLMDKILELFGEEIVWDKLHITDKDTDMYHLQQIIKNVRNVTSLSNRHANEIVTDE